MKTSDEIRIDSDAALIALMKIIKKSILIEYDSFDAFCKATNVISGTRLSIILNTDKPKLSYPDMSTFLAIVSALDLNLALENPKFNLTTKDLKRVPTTIDYARELVVPEKELQKQKDVEARAAEKSEKESRKSWHPSRHKLILPPEETDIETVHDYLMSMAARMHAVTGFSCRGIFDFVADTSDSWSYWIGGHGYPHLRIPADLSQCGELAGEHWNKKEMHSIFGIKPEWVRYANPNEIHYYYNAIFLPQFKKLKDLLETGFEPDDKPHVFGGKTALYWKNSLAVPWVKQSLKTPGVDMRLVGAPFRHLDYLDWDYENDCAIVIPDPRILKWEEVFTRDNRDGVYDDKIVREIE